MQYKFKFYIYLNNINFDSWAFEFSWIEPSRTYNSI